MRKKNQGAAKGKGIEGTVNKPSSQTFLWDIDTTKALKKGVVMLVSEGIENKTNDIVIPLFKSVVCLHLEYFMQF